MSAFFFAHPKETDLALFAGGESGPFARWRIERHLETCPRCEQSVAGFFHLAEELSVLGDTPDMDWAAMSAGIQARLAIEGSDPQPGRAMPAWTWQFGAVAACAMAAFAVLYVGPQTKKTQAPAPEQTIADNRALVAESAGAPAERESADPNEESRRAAPPLRQLALLEADAARNQMLERKEEAPAPETLAFADRADEILSTDAAAPPPPAAKAVAVEAESIVAGQESRARDALEGARALGGVVSGAALRLAGNSAGMEEVAFSVMPLPAADEDSQIGANGWISVRSINSDGALTITDVYEPQ